MLSHFERDLDELKEKGFTDILHTVSENDMKFYKGTMKDFIKKSKEKGFTVTVSPWSYGLVFGGEAFSEFPILYPEACQVTQDGRKLPNACFNNLEFIHYMKVWISAVSDMGTDYILWDEPHWAGGGGWYALKEGEWSCRCEKCCQRYQEIYEEEMPLLWSDRIQSFRKRSMVDFIQEVSSYSKKKGIKNIICFFPNRINFEVPNEWEAVASLESIDIFATDPYWVGSNYSSKEYVEYYVEQAVKIGDKVGKEVQLYIQNFRIEAEEEYKVKEAVEVGLQYGINYFYTWGFNSCAHMSFLASDNPELAFLQYYQTLQNNSTS
ncbi:hypothetical protein QGM71_05425 [Virgibacillus sp. C22-A2]|uniref:Beta-xylosidase n=2 Tax=Virgibacillus tibetensis TaxID=3042313 RepID=A0ABU6KC85_9BACI|nr:hypothetical protein [Virgibacillus sp. C22-A2]